MILTRTPFRIPLGGGGTDLPAFYSKHGGFLFSVCINKYMYVAVNRSQVESLIRVTHSDAEVANNLEEVKHDLAREAIKKVGLPAGGLEVVSFADLPPGTGMGSSGSYLVGVLKALQAFDGQKELTAQELAELAFHIEIDILNKPVGKQDQYLAAFGGFLAMDIDTNGKVEAHRPKFKPELIDELKNNALMFYTFKRHDTVAILSEQSKKAQISGGQVETAMLKIMEIGRQMKSEMEAGNLRNFGKLMNEHWVTKKTISTQMSDPFLDGVYDLALSKGADGGKIMGSGGGGCFLFYVPGEKKQFILEMEKAGLKHLPYEFEPQGAKIL
jgi:D-glycero-alpha-D-manno-heptose-7-phosphate kinase